MICLPILRAAVFVAILAKLAQAGLTTCPNKESTYVAPNGINIYTICPGSDYVGNTAEAIKDVNDAVDCLYRCAERSSCDRAVYEPSARKCHIKFKGDDVDWVANSRYDAIRLRGITNTQPPTTTTKKTTTTTKTTTKTTAKTTTKPTPTPTGIETCPGAERLYTSTNGKKYAICENNEFRGADLSVVGGILTVEACASLCATNQGCTRASFEKYPVYNCHLKQASTGKTVFTAGNGFDAIREVA